jgi:hypothetical protein
MEIGKSSTANLVTSLSSSALAYQIGGSKQCLESHGIKSPNWFAAKYGDVWNNATVINAISNIINLQTMDLLI